MANGTVNVGGQAYNWATSTGTVTPANAKLKKALAAAELSFFQKAVDYLDDEGSPKSKPADDAIGRCDKQPGTGHLAWQIGKSTYGDLKFDATSAHRLVVAAPADRLSVLTQLFAISNVQGCPLNIT